MPVRVTPQPHVANASSYASSTDAPNYSRADDSGSGVAGRARKKFQKSTPDNPMGSRWQGNSTPTVRNGGEMKSTLSSRRRSIRDQKAPLGPRPPDFSPSKSDNLHNPARATARSYIPTVSTELNTPDASDQVTSINGTEESTLSSRDSAQAGPGTFDFLPSVSFDELHSSIASTDLTLSDFPAPGGGGILDQKGIDSSTKKSTVLEDSRVGGTRFGRTGSLTRRQSSVPRPNGQPAPNLSNADPHGSSSSTRTRRQSHFSSASTNPTGKTSRAPRKSIGPGVIDADFANKMAQHKLPTFTPSGSKLSSTDLGATGLTSTRFEAGGIGNAGTSAGGSSKNLRDLKAKSFQPAPRQGQGYLSTPSMTPEHNRSGSIFAARSPAGQRTQSPSSSSSKRMSVMSPHATGLGARTVSPTDARRLKRMSMLQDPPPMPTTPPTPQPEGLPEARFQPQSPSIFPRKSSTPSSSRTTPDQSRKSYSSGLSASSNTSTNSVRTSGSLQPRLSQSYSTSRLPTPKPRNIPSAAGGEDEEVPPVPAIPKAYESPKEYGDRSVFNVRKSSLPLDTSSMASVSAGDAVSATPESKRHSRFDRNSDRSARQTKGPTLGSNSDAENKGSNAANASKRSLPPLRLPPINVLPLSTPTVAKVASFKDNSSNAADHPLTPPPKRGKAKTPSTPMTASKSSFFSQIGHPSEQDLSSSIQRRSNSSNHHVRTDSSSMRATSSSSASLSHTDTDHSGRQTMTPFISSSLPKSSGDFGYMRPKDSGNYNTINLGGESRLNRLNGPRAQTSKTDKVESGDRASSPSEIDSPSSTSSLRRKLSLNFKKNLSKDPPVNTENDGGKPPRPPKHDDMPPPRLPASATWNGSSLPSPSPQVKSTTQLSTARRKSSAPGLIGGHDRTRSDTWSGGNGESASPKKQVISSFEPERTIATSKTTSSLHRILGTKSSWHSASTKQPDSPLDRDDQSAEDEMKKLASKRKGFEAAAKEVDTLRRRASPKERVAPMQALRMVNLNIFERGEIIDYREVYFCGTPNAKKHVGDLNAHAANFGYDDDRGDYNIVNGDHLAYRYEIVDILGKGSFGQVVRCIDHKTGGLVAIKIIRNKKRFHQQALVEVNILQKLKEWDPECKHSMVSFTQSFYFRGHLCISTELLGMNLYEFIKSNDFNGFSLKLIRRFTKQLLSSLVLLQRQQVIHCDLKPENILLAHPIHSEIKVIDFGSSCFENERVYTYIQSRFYRSPEVILGMTYGMPIDMWSLGCILAELYTGVPIFPGENEQEQLSCIMEVFGPPEKHLIEKSTRKKLFFDSLGKPRLTVSSKGRRRRPSSKTLQQALKCDDEAFLDFINRCLRWDPERRVKPDEALLHEFITGKKKSVRNRSQTTNNNTNSPVKRFNSVHTPASSRPLPDPPATSFKRGNAFAKSNNTTTSSPSRPMTVKRHTTVTAPQPTVGVKRMSNGAAIGSSLPKVSNRSTSGKGEMAASAAAIAIGSVGKDTSTFGQPYMLILAPSREDKPLRSSLLPQG
ncbi:MAG: hypothetical protein M1837_005442 [Sclerophora amabilis]|nr:MAG: hypothetical protein M1837_005442 [Sclerophora amabilis]